MEETVRLLQSCHRGTVTAVQSLEQVLAQVNGGELRQRLQATLTRHRSLEEEIGGKLRRRGAAAQGPGAAARAGVWVTTELRMMGERRTRDRQIAKLVINGCNTGIQTLSADLNRLPNAAVDSRELAAVLVREEQQLMEDLRTYL